MKSLTHYIHIQEKLIIKKKSNNSYKYFPQTKKELKDIILQRIKTEGNKVTMEITGWLDTQTSPQLGEELSKLDDSVTSLIFDFAKLEYISSAGLRQVISAYKKMAGKDGFKIINVSDEVFDVFRLTGFDQKIQIEK